MPAHICRATSFSIDCVIYQTTPSSCGARHDFEVQTLTQPPFCRVCFCTIAARAWAEVKELMGDTRPATPPVVKRLLAPPKPSPRTTGWITRPVTQQSFSRPSPREATLPFAVNTITTRFSTTAHLYHDGIPGSPMTYFYDGL